MQHNIIESQEARLYRINGTIITFLQVNTLRIERNLQGVYVLMIGDINHLLTPSALIWFDSPNDDEEHNLVYYFRHAENQDYMIKIKNNTEPVHMAVRASGCQRRDRKIYFRNQRNGQRAQPGILDSLGTMLAGLGIGNMLQGGMQRLNHMMNPQNNQNPNFNPNHNQNGIRNQSPVNQNMNQQNDFRRSGSMDPSQRRDALRDHIIRQNQNNNFQNNVSGNPIINDYPSLHNPNSMHQNNMQQNNMYQNNPNNPQQQNNPLNYYRQALGNWMNNVNLNQYAVINEQDHPIVRAGKNMLGGAINMYNGMGGGMNGGMNPNVVHR